MIKFEESLKMYKKLPPLCVIFLILISGCEPAGGGYEYSVNNKSDYQLKVDYNTYENEDSTIVINPRENKIFFFRSWFGVSTWIEDDTTEFLKMFDTLSIAPVIDTLNLNKDVMDYDNWFITGASNFCHSYQKKCTTSPDRYMIEISNTDISN